MQVPKKQSANPYRNMLRQLRRTFVQVGLFSAAINLLMLTGPFYMLQVYDRVLSSGSLATLQGLFVIVVILYVFLGLYEFLRSRLLSRASYLLDTRVGADAFRFLLHGGIIKGADRFNPVRDLEIIRGFISSPAILGLFDLPWIPIFICIIFLIHPWLGYITIAGALVVVVVAVINRATTQNSIAEAMEKDAEERIFVERSRRNAEMIHSLGMQTKITQRWEKLHGASLAGNQRGGDRSEMFSSFSKAFRLLLQSALLTVGAYLALAQEISPGMIIAASIVAGRALAPVDQIIGQWRSVGRASEAHKRLKEALDFAPLEIPRIELPPLKGALKVVGLTKLTPSTVNTTSRSRILDQVSFQLQPGDGLGVMGNSAAGKSSLARLLVGAWRPDAGEIRLDGATIDQWRPEDLGRYVGYLPQVVEMLPGTVAENIARFEPNAGDADVIEAAKIAGVHDMVLGMPDGYMTHIGTPEHPLSGGQIQRLGLARAIYGMPKFIVLDEPNSNLDTGGDDALSDAIRTLRDRGSTVIVMAHRPSVIVTVNKILILHKGKMVMFGDKEEVLGKSVRPASSPPAEVPRKSG